jgi:hypothetical protein
LTDVILNSTLDREAFFFAACVAHRCAAWWASWFYANRALEAVPLDRAFRGEWCEIAYLLVSATRYALPSHEAIERAFNIVDEMEEYSREQVDRFGLGRSLCEKTSLVLIVLYYQQMLSESMTIDLPKKIKELGPQFYSYIKEAEEALETTHWQHTELATAVEKLQVQLMANIVSADVLVNVVGDRTTVSHLPPPREQVDAALAQLAPKLKSPDVPPVLVAEYLMAQYYRKAVSREAARTQLSAILMGVEKSGCRLELDRAEFRLFELILKNEDTRGAPSAPRRYASSRSHARH